jgi:hypothetical protein
MIKAESERGLGCVDASLLTSKGISGIYLDISNSSEEIGNVDVPLPNAIVVK